ncbi:unnamed protein product, partial [Allacma fusca]
MPTDTFQQMQADSVVTQDECSPNNKRQDFTSANNFPTAQMNNWKTIWGKQ